MCDNMVSKAKIKKMFRCAVVPKNNMQVTLNIYKMFRSNTDLYPVSITQYKQHISSHSQNIMYENKTQRNEMSTVCCAGFSLFIFKPLHLIFLCIIISSV